MEIPPGLRRSVGHTSAGAAWLVELPAIRTRLEVRWGLVVGPPFTDGMSAWTAPARTRAGADVVLKISLPHVEARDEAAALRHWDGCGSARLLAHAPSDWGLLLERCTPGVSLRDDDAPWPEQLAAGAGVLATLVGRAAPDPAQGVADVLAASGVTAMSVACDRGADALEETAERCRADAAPLAVDPGVVAHAAVLLRELPRSAQRAVVVHGDFNPGNVLRASRGPAGWLAIDPKPLVGDPAFDPWPLLSQVDDPFARPDPVAALRARVTLVAVETGLDAGRVAAWGIARAVQSAFWDATRDRWAPAQVELDRARTWAALSG